MIRTLTGDCRTILPTLDAGSVQCVVTSPPYFALRDYGTATWEGGDAACDHVAGNARNDVTPERLAECAALYGTGQGTGSSVSAMQFRDTCGKCGARRIDAQLGLESTPEAYLAQMVAVFREVKRVLRDDGTLFLNLGDSYADKQLQMMPARLAIALQADGWWLRSDIIWAKPNPMPESVQGSHVSRHMVTIADHARLSCLPHSGQRAGTVRTCDVPSVPPSEVSDREATLPAERQGAGHSQGTRGAARRAGEAPAVLSIAPRVGEPAEIRSDAEGQSDGPQELAEVSLDAAWEGSECSQAPTDEGQPDPSPAAQDGQQQVSADRAWQGAEASRARQAQGRDQGNGRAADGSGVAGDREGGQGALLLLRREGEADAGPCDTAQQGRPAHSDERRPGLLAVQQPEERQADPAALVPCPGCDRCVNGYIVNLSAGRPTSAHEHIFLLSKRSRYYYDADAVREELTGNTHWASSGETPIERAGFHGVGRRASMSLPVTSRSMRNVWTIATSPFASAHFATYPAELVARCIRAGTSERGCCAACGKPWVRVTERVTVRELADAQGTWAERPKAMQSRESTSSGLSASNSHNASTPQSPSVTTTGWTAGCKCEADTKPCVVLDPFAGAGTTMLVADRLQRDAIGIELNPAYVGMATERVHDDAPLFSSWPPAEDPADARMADVAASPEYEGPVGEQLALFAEAAE